MAEQPKVQFPHTTGPIKFKSTPEGSKTKENPKGKSEEYWITVTYATAEEAVKSANRYVVWEGQRKARLGDLTPNDAKKPYRVDSEGRLIRTVEDVLESMSMEQLEREIARRKERLSKLQELKRLEMEQAALSELNNEEESQHDEFSEDELESNNVAE